MSAPLSILVCDHGDTGLEPLAEILSAAGLQVERTHSLRQSLEALRAARPTLVLLRPMVAGGQAELRALDQARAEPLVPMLLVIEREGDGGARGVSATEAIQSPAWDLVYADSSEEEVLLRLQRLEREALHVAEVRDLRHRAWHDDRTDLLRGRAFEARLVEHFSAANRHSLDLGLVLIDLDGFGAINKEHDHTVGDILIQQVGEVIRRTLRAEDVAGRLGGDEFGVLLPYTSKVDTARVVARLCEQIHKLSGRPSETSVDLVVSGSLGFETYDGKDLDSAKTMRKHAESALREAKLLGGNRGIFFRSLGRPPIIELEED